jgi:hypothetical protein
LKFSGEKKRYIKELLQKKKYKRKKGKSKVKTLLFIALF